jgi:hypothetical protein
MLVLPDEFGVVACWRLPVVPAAGYASRTESALLVVETPVDPRNLCDPTLALGMLQRQDFLVRPVKVIRNVRYLLIQPL